MCFLSCSCCIGVTSSLQHRHRVLESFNKNIEILQFFCMRICFLYVEGENHFLLVFHLCARGSRGLAVSDYIWVETLQRDYSLSSAPIIPWIPTWMTRAPHCNCTFIGLIGCERVARLALLEVNFCVNSHNGWSREKDPGKKKKNRRYARKAPREGKAQTKTGELQRLKCLL